MIQVDVPLCVSAVLAFWEVGFVVLAVVLGACAEALPLPVLEVNRLWKKL